MLKRRELRGVEGLRLRVGQVEEAQGAQAALALPAEGNAVHQAARKVELHQGGTARHGERGQPRAPIGIVGAPRQVGRDHGRPRDAARHLHVGVLHHLHRPGDALGKSRLGGAARIAQDVGTRTHVPAAELVVGLVEHVGVPVGVGVVLGHHDIGEAVGGHAVREARLHHRPARAGRRLVVGVIVGIARVWVGVDGIGVVVGVQLARDELVELHEHLGGLGAGRPPAGVEAQPLVGVLACDDARGRTPHQGVVRPARDVGAVDAGSKARRGGLGDRDPHVARKAPHHGRELLARHVGVREEPPRVRAALIARHDALLAAPGNGRREVLALGDVVEAGGGPWLRRAGDAPQHRGHLPARDVERGVEEAREVARAVVVAAHKAALGGLLNPGEAPRLHEVGERDGGRDVLLPLGVEREAARDRRVEVVGAAEKLVGAPAGKGVALAHGHAGNRRRGAVCHDLRLNLRPTVGLEGNRAQARPLGVELEVRGDGGGEVELLGEVGVGVPALEGIALASGVGLGAPDALAMFHVLGGHLGAAVRHETHAVHLDGPLGMQRDVGIHGRREVVGFRAGGVGVPAQEGVSRSHRVVGLLGTLAVGDLLRVDVVGPARLEAHPVGGDGPLGKEHEVGAHRRREVVGARAGAVRVPADERVPRLDGRLGHMGPAALGHLLGLDRAAPVRGEGHRVDGRSVLSALGLGGRNLRGQAGAERHAEHARQKSGEHAPARNRKTPHVRPSSKACRSKSARPGARDDGAGADSLGLWPAGGLLGNTAGGRSVRCTRMTQEGRRAEGPCGPQCATQHARASPACAPP